MALGKRFKKEVEEHEKDSTLSCINPFAFSSKKICKIRNFSTELTDIEDNGAIKIASISMPFIGEAGKPYPNKKSYPHNQTVYHYDDYYRKLLKNNFKKCLSKVIFELKANIICINELGMPTNKDGTIDKHVFNFVKKLANENNCLIIAGTNHCRESYLNTGYIFHPGINSFNTDHHRFHKNISAFNTNPPEIVYTPSERILYHTKAFGLGISFLICLELADYSASAAIVRKYSNIDLLIVPTYVTDEFGTISKVAKSISEAINGIVLLVNTYISESLSPCRLFINGDLDIKEKDNRSLNISRIVSKDKPIISGRKTYDFMDSKIVTFNVSVSRLQKQKANSEEEVPEGLKCLFGIHEIIPRS